MKSNTTILYVIGSLDLGGTERHLAQLAPLLKKHGWSPVIYCLTHSGIQSGELERQGVTVIGPPLELKGKSPLVRFLGLCASCIKLLTILVRARPRIVHFFLPLSYLVGAPLAIVSRIPLRLMSRRSLNHYQKRHTVLSWFERRLHPYVTSALGNSQAVVNDLWTEGMHRSRTALIYNGIDLVPFDRLPPRMEAGRPRFVIIILANLIPYKGHAELIEAVGVIAEKMPADWQLWCVGRNDGLLASLERLAKEKNIEGNVKFLGPSVEVPTLLQSADISVSSSHEEGFSNAILEAMAASLPVVATDVGGNAEAVVHGETGLIVPAKNPIALAEAILYLAQHSDIRERMGAAGRLRVQTHFSIDRCAQEYSDHYSSVLEAHTAAKPSSSRPRLMLERLVRSRTARVTALLCVSLTALFVVVQQVGFSEIIRTLHNVPVIVLLFAAGMMVAGASLASVRLYFIAKDLGWTLTIKEALLALSVGQLASAASIQFFGQIVGRSAVLGSRGLSTSTIIAITTYERLSAVVASFSLAGLGAWYLFGRLAIDLRAGGDQFLLIAAGLACATVFGAVFGWGPLAFTTLTSIVSPSAIRAFLRNLLLAFLIQFLTAGAYVALASAVAPNLPLSDLVAASLIVMFAASLPISFAGWGVRELSAAIALSTVGMASGAAVATAILVGILALLSVVVIAAIAFFLPRPETRSAPPPIEKHTGIETGISWILSLAVATALLFQLHVPVGGSIVNVNLADPIVILGGSVFALSFVATNRTDWRLPNLNTYVLISTCVLGLALLNGFIQYGWIDWAFMNKGLGWLILLCYGATGALVVRQHSEQGFSLLARSFVGAVCGILFLAIAVIVLRRSGLMLPRSWFAFPLEGFSQNRNAFALILTIAVCLLPWIKIEHQSWLLGLLLAGIWLAGSRASFGAISVLLVLQIILKQWSLGQIAKSIASLVCIVAFIELTPLVALVLTGRLVDADAIPTIWSTILSPISDRDRLKSILDGLTMFQDSPILGQGLGAYLAQQKGAVHIVIHSTPIWLLAEMGLIGLLAFAVPALRIVQIEAATAYADRISVFLLGMLTIFGVMSAVHEMLYQRPIWFFFGAALAMTPSNRAARDPE